MELKTSYLPPVFFRISQQVLHFVAIPIFSLLFTIIYKPFGLEEDLTLEHGTFAFNSAICSAIILLTLVGTRLLLWAIRNVTSIKRRTYLLWCIGETALAALFISMYITLISSGKYSYIDVLPIALGYLASIVIYPYIILTLLLESDIMARYTQEPEDDSRLRFYDDKHNLKFITTPSAIIYVESSENYCDIFYMDGNKMKKFTLRTTMKALGESLAKHGILRCHRSYYINTRRIKVLRKERDGLTVAEMDVQGLEGIPVTPRYYNSIEERF